MFHMTNDSGLFRARADLVSAGWDLEANRFEKDGQVMLPLYEGKMITISTTDSERTRDRARHRRTKGSFLNSSTLPMPNHGG